MGPVGLRTMNNWPGEGQEQFSCQSVKGDETDMACSMHREKSNAYVVLVGKPEGNRPLGRPKRKWEDNIKVDLREIRWNVMDWIHLTQDKDQRRALVNTIMNLRVE
jgi:hypothetical protein